MNALLLSFALKTLGWRFCVKTIYGVLVMTFAVGFMREAFPNPTILSDQPFMVALIGSLFCGLGLGFCLSYNGSSGGSDIVAAIVNKYHDISLGRVLILVDTSIVTLSYVVLNLWLPLLGYCGVRVRPSCECRQAVCSVPYYLGTIRRNMQADYRNATPPWLHHDRCARLLQRTKYESGIGCYTPARSQNALPPYQRYRPRRLCNAKSGNECIRTRLR